jgi:hypothetical protein
MSQDEKDKNYVKFLLEELYKCRQVMDFELLSEVLDETINPEDGNSELKSYSEFVESFTRDLNLVFYLKKKETDKNNSKPKKYVVNGIELTRDYYSIRTDAPRILGISAQTLNSRVNDGTIECLPEFDTKKVSAEKLYNYWVNYEK